MSTVTVPENKLAELQIKASQRDELLEALEAIVAISDRKHNAWDKAKTAIAKAKVG